MSTTTTTTESTAASDIEARISEQLAHATALEDDADAVRISLQLRPKLEAADHAAHAKRGQHLAASEHLADARNALAAFDHDGRDRAERVRDALATVVGIDLADQVADQLASESLERDAASERVRIADQLTDAQVPPDTVRATLALLGEQHAAKRARLVADVTDAEAEEARLRTDAERLEAERDRLALAVDQPLAAFEYCDAWLTRVARPRVYRAIIRARTSGAIVDQALYELALAAASISWKADAALTGELADVVNTARDRERLIGERDQMRRLGLDQGWRIGGAIR
ncbi:MAG TPA: hypothetical protein VGY48_12090 [Vicinamibacterales bacterium]|jgi:hypothetical protein|nr:hypothetical protein [Vicinamibacterales bacterium]